MVPSIKDVWGYDREFCSSSSSSLSSSQSFCQRANHVNLFATLHYQKSEKMDDCHAEDPLFSEPPAALGTACRKEQGTLVNPRLYVAGLNGLTCRMTFSSVDVRPRTQPVV